jgi:Protein of unknown function, DUF255
MTFIQALYGGGGWPLSVFLSPNLKPLMGGTYFPPDDKYGRPGFKTVLRLESISTLEYLRNFSYCSQSCCFHDLSTTLIIYVLAYKSGERICILKDSAYLRKIGRFFVCVCVLEVVDYRLFH